MANQRRMTMQEQREYDQLTKKAEQLEFSLDDLLYQPVDTKIQRRKIYQ